MRENAAVLGKVVTDFGATLGSVLGYIGIKLGLTKRSLKASKDACRACGKTARQAVRPACWSIKLRAIMSITIRRRVGINAARAETALTDEDTRLCRRRFYVMKQC